MRRRWWLVLAWLACARASAAPAKPSGPPRRTVVRFDGDDIDGALVRPDGDLVAGRPAVRRPPLAQPPRDFAAAARREALEAAGRLRRP
jgi:hypothetical protein